MKKELLKIGYNSKIALQVNLSEKIKNKVLNDYFLLIKKNKTKIIISNKKDINFAIKKGIKNNLIERLKLDEKNRSNIILY